MFVGSCGSTTATESDTDPRSTSAPIDPSARARGKDGRQLLDGEQESVLGPGGFDPATDITAITVNRWPHGYAYEYNQLFDPEWPEAEQPHVIGRARFGRIVIANSDSGAAAYTDSAIDQAYRAVQELSQV